MSLTVALAKFFKMTRIIILMRSGQRGDLKLSDVKDALLSHSMHFDLWEAPGPILLDIPASSVVLDSSGLFRTVPDDSEMFNKDVVWLTQSAKFDESEAPLSLRLNSNFVVATAKQKGHFQLEELYRVKGHLFRTELGTWSADSGLVVQIPFVWKRRGDLQGTVLETASIIEVTEFSSGLSYFAFISKRTNEHGNISNFTG